MSMCPDASHASLLSPDLDSSDISDDASGTKAVPKPRPRVQLGEQGRPVGQAASQETQEGCGVEEPDRSPNRSAGPNQTAFARVPRIRGWSSMIGMSMICRALNPACPPRRRRLPLLNSQKTNSSSA